MSWLMGILRKVNEVRTPRQGELGK
jgi:hypothetical protein